MQTQSRQRNRKHGLLWALALAVNAALLIAPGAAAEEALSENVRDAVLQARIETAYAMNDTLSAMGIDTSVENGVVTLTGEVAEYSDIQLAEDLAKSFDETESVVNDLDVAEADPAPGTKKPQWRRNIDDAFTAANVRRRIAYHTGLRNLALDIDVDGATVSVSGEVDSAVQQEAVVATVRDTKGVETVSAALTVVDEESVTKEAADVWDNARENGNDEWIEKRVETSLLLSQSVDLLDLDVEVDNHVCVLTGYASTEDEKQAAERIAADVYGVKEVVNEIEVV